MNRVRKFYSRYNHEIRTLQTDSLSAYQSEIFEIPLFEAGIMRRESSPLEHQQNGLVERVARTMEEQIASTRAAAPWVPKRFITYQILLWSLLYNLLPGSELKISREEEFTGKRPTILEKEIPGAWGDAFLIHEPKDLRKEKFDAHTRGPVMYLGPNIKTKDGHIFYDPITRKILTRRSYRRINGVPPEWVHVRTSDTFNNDDLSQVYDDYDIWHRGATYITTATPQENSGCLEDLEGKIF